MEKRTSSAKDRAKSFGSFILWPPNNHDVLAQKNTERTASLHARFNPRLVGFGIVSFSTDPFECTGDRRQNLQGQDRACDTSRRSGNE